MGQALQRTFVRGVQYNSKFLGFSSERNIPRSHFGSKWTQPILFNFPYKRKN